MNGAPEHMEEKQYDVQPIKNRLYEYRDKEREIENQTQLVERLIVKMEGMGAQEITGMPRSPSPPLDRMSDLLSQKVEVEKTIAEDLEELKAEREYISGILQHLKSADERAVIRFRYLVGLSWYDVTDALFGAKADYLEKESSYLRRTMNIHGQALLHMAQFIENSKQSDLEKIFSQNEQNY